VGDRNVVRAGSVSPALLRHFDIRNPVWYADVNWENVMALIPRSPVVYKVPEKYPAVRRDLSLLVDQSVSFADIASTARSVERKLLRQIHLFDVYEGKNLDAGKKSYAVSFVLQDPTRTMTDDQVDQVMSKIQKMLGERLGASLRTA
jgi:phenylalanyl-tRNA synthetase beta chain